MNAQKGSALLIVLMILALMAALAAEMTISFQVQLQRTRRINDSLQGKYALLYAEAQSMARFQEKPGDVLTHSESPGDDTDVSWQINDLHHCYNLNALKNTPEEPLATPPYEISVFYALLEKLAVEKYRAEEIAQSIADYIDDNDSTRVKGAEDEYYQHSQPGYLTAGQVLFLPTEVRKINGMTDALYQKLAPFICTRFSSDLAININTLTEQQAPLLAALFLNNISLSDAKMLLKKRPVNGWEKVEDFLYQAQQDFSAAKPLVDSLKKQITTSSSYFLTTSTVHEGDLTFGMRTFFIYDEKTKTLKLYLRQLTDGSSEQ